MYKIKVWLRHYFGFTASESKGFVILVLLFFVILYFPSFYKLLNTEESDLHAHIEFKKADSLLTAPAMLKSEMPERSLFTFNPNTASEKEFVSLGIPSSVSKRIIKYRTKGGHFRKKEDLSKIYGLSPGIYKKLEPYILIQESEPTLNTKYQQNKPIASKFAEPENIDINFADTSQLKLVRGIGSKLAGRIVKYRKSLGGFASKDQLYEVYGLDSATVMLAFKKFLFSNEGLNKISINTVSADSLSRHPYVGKKKAKIIVNYREHHGHYKSPEDLLNTKAIDPESLSKLIPYLVF